VRNNWDQRLTFMQIIKLSPSSSMSIFQHSNIPIGVCGVEDFFSSIQSDLNVSIMELTLKRKIASRGWHVYGKTVWSNPRRGESVFAEKENNPEALLADSHSVSWKRKFINRLIADVVGHVPREISRAVWYFITHGGSVTGTVYSPAYYPSPIAQRGLEILLECEFKIDVTKMDLLKRLEEILDRNYRDPSENSIAPVALDSVSNFLENDEEDIFEDAIRIESDEEDDNNETEEGVDDDSDIE